jgi:hypothetical protein
LLCSDVHSRINYIKMVKGSLVNMMNMTRHDIAIP